MGRQDMKRYLLFAGYCYYASGGFNDFRGSFDTITETMDRHKAGNGLSQEGMSSWEWYQVFDRETGRMSAWSEDQPHGADNQSIGRHFSFPSDLRDKA